jgi:hypothetical protein
MGNSSGKLAKQKSSDLAIGTGVFLVALAFILFVISLWGYVILPKNCLNDEIRSSSRTAIIVSCVMLVVYVSFAACKANCLAWVEGNDKEIFDEDPDYRTPSSLLIFTMGSCAVYMGMIATMQKHLSDEDNKDCQGSGYSTWNMAANISYLFSIGGVVVPIIMFFYRFRTDTDISRRKREHAVSQVQLINRN